MDDPTYRLLGEVVVAIGNEPTITSNKEYEKSGISVVHFNIVLCVRRSYLYLADAERKRARANEET